jgi:mannose-6-phosphate isomerase-like protein (cupin superfamily)
MVNKVNIDEKFEFIHTHWDPKIIGELNHQQVKLVKFKGEFVWHKHENEDELFLTIKGNFDMHLRDGIITVDEGEFIIIPRGVEHKPVAEEEVQVLLFEPESVVNTGNTLSKLTRTDLDKI